MKIIISTKNISLDDALITFVEDKIGGLSKFLNPERSREGSQRASASYGMKDPVEVRVEIGKPSKHHRSGRVYYAEVNMKVGGKLLRATCQHEDLRNAIVDVKNEMQGQINKFKSKTRDKNIKKFRK